MAKVPRFSDIHHLTQDTYGIEAVKRWYGLYAENEKIRRQGFDRVHTLMNDNRAEFAKLYGKRHQVMTTEFRFDIWRVESEGFVYWLLTAKTKGSIIRFEMPPVWGPDDDQKVVRFLEGLHEELQLLAQRAEDVNDELA